MKLVFANVSKRFGDAPVLQDCSLEVASGQITVLLGPSGCGKTTLLRLAAGLETPTSGAIRIGEREVASPGKCVPTHLRGVGMVFQSYALWPHKNALGNVTFPLLMQKRSAADAKTGALHALSLVGLAGFETRMPDQLSGGQQQRVALARTIAQNPGLVLMDEPLSNLDAKLRDQLRSEIKTLQKQLGWTMLYVTHDRREAFGLADEIVIMDQGRIVQKGAPSEILAHPANDFVRHLIADSPV